MAKIVKIKRYGRPNRAAVIPPNPPRGLELEQATNDLLKPKDCKKQVLRGGRLVSFGESRRAASGRALADTDF